MSGQADMHTTRSDETMAAQQADSVPADLPLMMGLPFHTLAPMRNRDRLRAMWPMGTEEAAYWLGMAIHRKHPRRVQTALRILCIELTGGADHAGCLVKRWRLGTGNYRAGKELRLQLDPHFDLAASSRPRSG